MYDCLMFCIYNIMWYRMSDQELYLYCPPTPPSSPFERAYIVLCSFSTKFHPSNVQKKKKFNSLYKIKKQYSRPNLFFKNLPYSEYFLLEPCSSSTVFIVFFPSRLCVWFVFPIRQWSVQGNFWQSINGIHKLANFTHSFLFYGAAVSFCYALVITWFVLAWHLLSQWGLRLIWN